MMELQKKSKKIVFITGTLPPTLCGVGMYSYRLLEELSKDKTLDIHVITSDIKNIQNINNIKIYKVSKEWNIKTFNQIVGIIKKINPDIIHFQHPTLAYQFKFDTFILGLKLKKNFPKIPKIITEHELSQAHPIARIRNLTILPFFDYIIFTNSSDLKYFKKLWIFNSIKTKVIPIFPNNHYNIPTKIGKNFCYIGTIDNKKGIEYLIDAIKLLKDKNVNIKLDILTNLNPKMNSYHKKIVEKIRKLNLEDNIILNNPKDGKEIAKKIAQSFAVILPFNLGVSERNGTFLEAISYGKPVITTKGKNTPSNFINNQNCILIEPKNTKEIVLNIYKLMYNQKLYLVLSNGALILNSGYTLKNITNIYLAIYKNIKEELCI